MPEKHLMLGALGGAVFDLVIDIPLSQAGVFYVYEFKDPATGEWLYGVGLGDMLGFGIAGLATAYGAKKRNKALKDAGLGWLLGLTAIKISELYTALTKKYPTTPNPLNPWTPSASVPVVRVGTASLFGSQFIRRQTGTRQTPSLESEAYTQNALMV